MTLRKCRECETEKPLNFFYDCGEAGSGYKRTICIECMNARRRRPRKLLSPEIKKQKKDDHNYTASIAKYGLTKYEYMVLLVIHGKVCGICGKENSNGDRLFIDHDHNTGKVRGLLCRHCNTALGFFKDNIQNLKNAIQYLEKDDDTWIMKNEAGIPAYLISSF